jgi:hypothetical protein
MAVPFLTYSISDLPGLSGAANQAAATADRPLCGLMAAAASWCRGNKLRGAALGLTEDMVQAQIEKAAFELDVPPARAGQWIDGINHERLGGDVCTRILDKVLDPYQVDAIRRLTVAGGVFALDMGLGKTATSVVGIIHALMCGKCNDSRCWIVCPLNAMGAWTPYVPELQKYFREVRVLSVDSSHKYCMTTPTGGALIFDEVHMLGSGRANRTHNCHQLRRLFDFCVANTGTLLHAGIEKCLSVLDLAIPGAAAFASRWKCGEHFHCLVEKKVGSHTYTSLANPSQDEEARFAAYLEPYVTILDTDSPSVADSIKIPPQTTEEIILSVPWKTIDDAVVDEVEKALAAGQELPSMPEVAHLLSRADVDAKIKWMDDRLDDTPLVIFAHYTPTMDALEAWLKGRGVSYRRIDGDTPQKDRPAIEASFQAGEFQVLLGQMRAAGVALNLFRAWISIAVDFSWNPVDYAQAKRRTRRRGQTNDCIHFDLVANRFQATVLSRIRAGQRFNASIAAYQEVKRAYAARVPNAPVASPADESTTP